MKSFEYNSNPARVLFGQGRVQNLPQELQKLGVKAPFLLSAHGQSELASTLCSMLGSSSTPAAGVYNKATMHTPSHITEEALSLLESKHADSVVSIGGGSTIGLGKALSERSGIAHICIPTTYAGSEMTPILGETVDGKKVTHSDPTILPAVVIYDVNLTMTLPPSLTASSGVNAIAHAIETLYAPNTNPILDLLALEAIEALVESLPVLIEGPRSVSAREQAQYGAWLCGMCLGASGMGLHHKLCHTLGGSFNLPHSETHTVVLPHALAYNAPKIPKVMARLTKVVPNGNGDAIEGLNQLLDQLKVTRALSKLGMKEEDVKTAAKIACSAQYPNPRALEESKISELLRRCWSGEPARADL